MEEMGTEAFAMAPYARLLPNQAKPELPALRHPRYSSVLLNTKWLLDVMEGNVLYR